MNKVFISVTGEDRPGILSVVSEILFTIGCNIENISQTILQNVFGALFIASIPEDLDEDSLQARLTENLDEFDLDVFVKDYRVSNKKPVESLPFVITTFGPDRPGLVHAITSIFYRNAINVTNLKAVFKGGEDPHENVMIFEVDVPADLELKQLRSELQEAATRLDLDLNIQHRQIFETMNRI